MVGARMLLELGILRVRVSCLDMILISLLDPDRRKKRGNYTIRWKLQLRGTGKKQEEEYSTVRVGTNLNQCHLMPPCLPPSLKVRQ